jgi:subtilase family serine protease
MKSMITLACLGASATADIHVRPNLGLGWRPAHSTSLVSAEEEVSFSVSLKNQNMDKLKDIASKVSDPKSPEYTKYLTTQEIRDMTKPKASDIKIVLKWATSGNMKAHWDGTSIRVKGPVKNAEALLKTNFEVLSHSASGKHIVRAGDYTLPSDVEAATASMFGLHGLPLPKAAPLVSIPGTPADVTPEVIATTYSVEGVKPTGSVNNRQAVAEFQGQTEQDSDLVAFFKQYVPHAEQGDDKVYAFKGDKNKENPQVEASLDIQYIMGVAPHVKTEFWLFLGMDFCADLVEWTNDLIKGDNGPNVHSISYGWQGNLTQVHCTDDKVHTIDENYAKLAAAGVSIIFASGDSGSGYAPTNLCMSANSPNNLVWEGDVERQSIAPEAVLCCEEAGSAKWSFEPIKQPPTPGNTCQNGDIGKKDTAYTGVAHQIFHVPNSDDHICCELSGNLGGLHFTFVPGDKEGTCTLFSSVNGSHHEKGALAGRGTNHRATGNCTIFSKTTGTKTVEGATSSKDTPGPSNVQLWPSWPASSPWITAVGATRFVDQKVGKPEMATDQFGSGGGFSAMFKQSPHAKWQMEAVAHYVNNPPKDSHYPPAGSFDPLGRATPDISALGEGYQVLINGRAEAVGGTSASTPAFAGLVSLINDARIQAGKKQLGFLNPFLYQNADAFTDVTLGTNAIGRGNGPIAYGFNATAGWDPATGLGTPIFGKLLKAALALP